MGFGGGVGRIRLELDGGLELLKGGLGSVGVVFGGQQKAQRQTRFKLLWVGSDGLAVPAFRGVGVALRVLDIATIEEGPGVVRTHGEVNVETAGSEGVVFRFHGRLDVIEGAEGLGLRLVLLLVAAGTGGQGRRLGRGDRRRPEQQDQPGCVSDVTGSRVGHCRTRGTESGQTGGEPFH